MTVTAVTALNTCMTSHVLEKLCLVSAARVASAASRCFVWVGPSSSRSTYSLRPALGSRFDRLLNPLGDRTTRHDAMAAPGAGGQQLPASRTQFQFVASSGATPARWSVASDSVVARLPWYSLEVYSILSVIGSPTLPQRSLSVFMNPNRGADAYNCTYVRTLHA